MQTAATLGLADPPFALPATLDRYAYSFSEDALLPTKELADAVVGSAPSGYTFDAYLCAQFKQLAEQWRDETIHLSSLTGLANNEAYRKIIGMGRGVVPFILHELVVDPDWWFMALDALVDDPPNVEGSEGDLMELSQAWIQWGKTNGYFSWA